MICPQCRARNPENAKICVLCGGRLPRAEAGQAEPPMEDLRLAPRPVAPDSAPGYGEPWPGREPPEEIPSYLLQAILVTILCCWPAGIVSIVYAARVNGAVQRGDLVQARRLSRNARTWAWVSLWFGLAASAIYTVLIATGAAGA